MKRFKHLILVAGISAFCFPLSLYAQTDDWNTASGGNAARNGLSSACGPEGNSPLWEAGPVSVIAFPVAIDGQVAVTSRISDLQNTLDGTDIVAFDLATGDTLWTTQLPVDFPDTDWRNRASAISDGVVYATRSGNTNLSYLYALDAANGSIIWKSDELIDESSTESMAFAANGDPIIGNNGSVLRIDRTTGATVWMTARSTPTSNGQEIALYNGRGYYWEQSPQGPQVSVIDLESGSWLYATEGLGGLIQQVNLFVGPDGTIYAPRTQNNPVTDSLFAFTDTGSELLQKWSVPLGYVPFATFGVGPDGSVYSYSASGRVLRLDPTTGEAQDSSMVLLTSGSPSPRMAIGANGTLYVTDDGGSISTLFSFDPDLSIRWAATVPNVNIGGPALASDGTLIVAGTAALQAYAGAPCAVATQEANRPRIDLFPNPATDFVTILGSLETGTTVRLVDPLGRTLQERVVGNEREIHLTLSDLPPGWYAVQVDQNGFSLTRILLIQP